jgi:phosphatidylcholine synthase
VVPVDPTSRSARTAAWLVHAYTAAGSVLALLMVHFAYEGEVRAVLWVFLAAMFVDGTDGFLARFFHVKSVVPSFDGALLDNIVDYLTYVFAPMVLLWANGYLPAGVAGGICACVPLVASCYQFCLTDAKTDDHFFLGFPSYWNVVAFYVIVLELGPTTTAVLLGVFAVLVFVPVKYVYPSRTAQLWALNMTMVTLWLGLFAWITATLPDPHWLLVAASLVYVVYYTAESLWLTAKSGVSKGVSKVRARGVVTKT